jgi:hypothetical protein
MQQIPGNGSSRPRRRNVNGPTTFHRRIERELVSKKTRTSFVPRSRAESCQGSHIPSNLDLLQFPSILFYESGYSIYVLRQASRRSWRIGQKQPVRVKYMAYAGTMQENCLRLMGKKLLVSLAMEGKFANHGLQALDDDDDMLTAMARELVTQKGVGEKADACWREVQKEHTRVLEAQRIPVIEHVREPVATTVLMEAATTAPESPGPMEALVELAMQRTRVPRKPRYNSDAQMSLSF